MSSEKIKEVASFISYLNLKEEQWFIDLVNERGLQAEADRKAGKGFTSLADLQKSYE